MSQGYGWQPEQGHPEWVTVGGDALVRNERLHSQSGVVVGEVEIPVDEWRSEQGVVLDPVAAETSVDLGEAIEGEEGDHEPWSIEPAGDP